MFQKASWKIPSQGSPGDHLPLTGSLWRFQCWRQDLYFGDICSWSSLSPSYLMTVINIDIANVTFNSWLSPFQAGEAIGQTIVCMDDSFEVHEWCLFNSDILLSFFEGKLFRISIRKWTVMAEIVGEQSGRSFSYDWSIGWKLDDF